MVECIPTLIAWCTAIDRELHLRKPGGTVGYPAPPRLIRPSVRPWVHACRLVIQRKIAQAQQIRSNFLQNHESTWIVNQIFFKIMTWNWWLSQKSGKLTQGSSSPHTASVFCEWNTRCRQTDVEGGYQNWRESLERSVRHALGKGTLKPEACASFYPSPSSVLCVERPVDIHRRLGFGIMF